MALEDIWVDKMPWPPSGEKRRLSTLRRYNELFEGDPDTLRAWVKHMRRVRKDEMLNEFVPFPAPEIAAKTLASFLFGEPVELVSETDQDELNAMIEDNHLHALNQEAAVSCATEGEIFYKIDWDEDLCEYAIISTVPASQAFPVFRFRRLVEIAFVSEIEREDQVVVRHVELRLRGKIINRVFKGSDDTLGIEYDLERYDGTEDLEEEVDTGFDQEVLARHVPFWRTSKSAYGISIFRGKEGLIEALHSLYSQDQHDAEMAKRRVAVAANYLQRDRKGRPKFDKTLDLFELSDEAGGAIGSESRPVHAIEFNDTTVMGQRIAQRLDEFLLACGIAPQSAGRDVSGTAESGTARKLAQSLTVQTVATAGRYFAPGIRDIAQLGLLVGKKHLGRSGVTDDPAVNAEMQDGFADDPKEQADILVALDGAKAVSMATKVAMLHPDWDEDKINTEVQAILDEQGLAVPDPFKTTPSGQEGEDEEDEE